MYWQYVSSQSGQVRFSGAQVKPQSYLSKGQVDGKVYVEPCITLKLYFKHIFHMWYNPV